MNHSSLTNINKNIKVAAVDFVPAWGDLDGNISRLVDAVKKISSEGVNFAVFPETAISGYIFTDYNEISPYLDTIPGKMTNAICPLLAENGMYMSIGIAEKDAETGLAYNSAVLMGPSGIIGKYRKIGLNSQDQKIFSTSDTGVRVFDTEIGKIALLICYDDTYWQYARLATLKGAQIISWHSVSDRLLKESSTEAEMRSDHSTIGHVQHMSALNGVWVICTTRSGIETNLITKKKVYYNGGSSIWSPEGHKVCEAEVVPPIEREPGLNEIYTALVDLSEADKKRKEILRKRNPRVYFPLLTLHHSSTVQNGTKEQHKVKLTAVQWDKNSVDLDSITVSEGELLVLPELSNMAYSTDPSIILAHSESCNGSFEQKITEISQAGKGYVVGSYPQIIIDKVYHTVVLAGPEGNILARYNVTHLNERDKGWATAGTELSVTKTPIGHIALAAAHELEVPELGGSYCALRADIIAAPAGLPGKLKVEIDERLYVVSNPPTNKADYIPYSAGELNQLWVVCGGRPDGIYTSAGIYGSDPIMISPTLLAQPNSSKISYEAEVPAQSLWINQNELLSGQQPIWYTPLVLDVQEEK
ncbi:nitrilase-related carbon-nitrogen hydrolase [Providencia sp. Me31A]|uniref:nitrilase-related carbon-nitrogen hydrolase n=1 Tax=Providencia sp. Me31A TaxID=3392637 RepID=UPI003D2D867A